MCLCMEKNIKKKNKPYLEHLKNADDLVTTYEAVRAGFVALALEKNRRATPFVEQARSLKVSVSKAKTPKDLLDIAGIQSALLTAAGVSDKAAGHLLAQDKLDAINGLIKNFLEPTGSDFIEELIFRFLLIRGDTLGGSMRNIGGALAQRKLTRAIISALRLSDIPYQWLHSLTNSWVQMTDDDADIELSLRGLSWQNKNGESRTIIYNLTVPLVKNNADLCLFNCNCSELSSAAYNKTSLYIALGELKGGIDPAGADEHWKTARTALNRIQKAFSDKGFSPCTFFIGAAVEKRMANEIWNQLEEGILDNAANLTDSKQIASLSHWLCNL